MVKFCTVCNNIYTYILNENTHQLEYNCKACNRTDPNIDKNEMIEISDMNGQSQIGRAHV